MSIDTPYSMNYEHVAASQTAQVLGSTGFTWDYLQRLVCTVSTAATSTVTLLDDTQSHVVLPANVGGGIRVYVIEIGASSKNGAWKVTTAAGVEVLAIGIFS